MTARLSGGGTAVLLAAASLVMASTTCVTAVLPQVAADVGTTQTELQWVADAYPLVLAALLLPAGALLDRAGRKLGLLAGLALLTAALGWSAVADTPGALIASRALAGVGGALVFPATLATLSAGLSGAARSRAVAMWAGAVMAGGGYGLILGGLMAETSSWTGAFVVIAGIGALTAAIIESPVRGLDDPLVLVLFVAGLILLTAFVRWELRAPHPLLEVRLLADRVFGSAAIAILAMFAAAFGWFFVAFQFYAYVFDWSPLTSGLGLLPNIVPLVAFVPVGIVLERRIGRRRTLVLALTAMGAGALLTGFAGRAEEPLPVMAGFAFIGLGGGLGQGPATQAIVDALPAAKQGVASAVNDLARELGAAIGIAVVGSAFTAGYRAEIAAAPGPADPALLASPAAADGALAALVTDATVRGWLTGMLAAAAILAVGAALVAVWHPRDRVRPT